MREGKRREMVRKKRRTKMVSEGKRSQMIEERKENSREEAVVGGKMEKRRGMKRKRIK